jgi:predicted neutral ceramidase superfamily lipid hydrolase
VRAPSIPREPLLLGLAGLIPFAALSVVLVFAPAAAPADAMRGLVIYAAVILSFMGGVHWGLALQQAPSASFSESVVPSLIAWAAAAFFEPKPALSVMAAGFLALLAYDLAVVRAGGAPGWYRPLRVGLTTTVVLAIGLTVICAPA